MLVNYTLLNNWDYKNIQKKDGEMKYQKLQPPFWLISAQFCKPLKAMIKSYLTGPQTDLTSWIYFLSYWELCRKLLTYGAFHFHLELLMLLKKDVPRSSRFLTFLPNGLQMILLWSWIPRVLRNWQEKLI